MKSVATRAADETVLIKSRTHDAFSRFAEVLDEGGLFSLGPRADDSSFVVPPSSGVQVEADPRRGYRRAGNLFFIYRELTKESDWCLGGSTATFRTVDLGVSPSGYPVAETGVLAAVQAEKQDLETRVADLETELGEIRTLLPALRALVDEYESAMSRVTAHKMLLADKLGARGSLEIARKRDVLDAPADESEEELV
jgi:uncharacterized coiled-coil protein SlyX